MLNWGLTNASAGVAKDSACNDGDLAPALLKYAWVDFGEQQAGETLFYENDKRGGWFPVHPAESKHWTKNNSKDGGCKEHTRKTLPIKLCWAWVIWKA